MTTERAPKNRNLTPPEGYGAIFGETLGDLPGSVESTRKRHFHQFQKIGLPGPKVETWKYSPLGPIAKTAFRPVEEATFGDPLADDYLLPDAGAVRLVFINGDLDSERSSEAVTTGDLTIAGIAAALDDNLIDADQLLADGAEDRGFDALNGAFADCGALIRVADGHAVPHPVQLLFINTGNQPERMINPRIVIQLGDGSSLDLADVGV